MRGRRNEEKEDKWPLIWSIMRKERIAILALQETHLTEEILANLRKKYPKLTLESNSSKSNAAGIAFMINTEIIGKTKWTVNKIIDDHASIIQTIDNDGKRLTIVNVYAPNQIEQKAKFYNELREKAKEFTSEIPILLGDFNYVEMAMDRSPEHLDDKTITRAFDKLRKEHLLIDGWRQCNPDTRDYTFQQATGSFSRIDRIYVNKEIFMKTHRWNISSSQNISDHQIVSVEIIKTGIPYIGKGLERLGKSMIEDPDFKKKATKILIETQKDLKKLEENNEKGSQEI